MTDAQPEASASEPPPSAATPASQPEPWLEQASRKRRIAISRASSAGVSPSREPTTYVSGVCEARTWDSSGSPNWEQRSHTPSAHWRQATLLWKVPMRSARPILLIGCHRR